MTDTLESDLEPTRLTRRERRAAAPLAYRRRNAELTLIILAATITAIAYTLASLGSNAEIPPGIFGFVAFVLGLLLVAHLVVRKFAIGADATLLPLAALLHGIGFVMITRLDDELAGLQSLWSLVGVTVFCGVLILVPRATDLARYRWVLFFAGAGGLLLPLVPGLGANINGARIWVSIGPINFQPGEFAKIALAIFFAAYFAENRELIAAKTWRVGPLRLPDPRFILPVLVAWGFAVVVMVGQRDLGSSLLFFTLFVVMIWVATERVGWLLLGAVLFAGAAWFSWSQFGHVQTRVDIWLDPWSDSLGRGYQIVQSLFGLADGGITGTGLGRGNPNQVPEAQNDFIFAAIGEELGLVGGTAILMSYLLIVGAGLRTALRTERTFEKLLAVGLTTIIGVQAFIIIGGVIKLVPLTGITLPFVSYGGSSLVSNYILLALLIRVSDSAARRLGEVPDQPTPGERWSAWQLRRQVRRDRKHVEASRGQRPMNRQIRQLAVGLMACYVVLFATLNYWQVAQEEELNANVENTRAVRREFNKPRGPIITADGIVAAESLPDPDPDSGFDRIRVYPTGDLLSNVTGYFTLNFGSTKVERVYGDVLTGDTTEQQIRALGDILSSDIDNSGSVQLAVRHDLQQVAKFALGGRTGSVVVIDIATGAVRAMYSNPTFDPNTFVTLPFEDAQEAIVDLQNAPGNPLLAGAYEQRFMPGSTFKVITTGIGLEAGVIDRTTEFVRESEWVPPQTTNPIENYRGSTCGGDLPEVFRRSCNIPFAQTAINLGPDRMVAGIEAWGIGEELPIDLPGAAASTFGDTSNLDQQLPLLGIRGFGQNDDQMVPLHMAMVAGTVANGGRMMAPYVVEATYDHDGRVLDRANPTVWKTPISAPTAALLTELMTGVTEGDRGTARSVVLDGGQRFAAKTGTAELGIIGDPDRVHAWMIGFAPLEAPKYAIAVVLTDLTSTQADAATGGREAGPVVKTVLDYLLTGPGAAVELNGG